MLSREARRTAPIVNDSTTCEVGPGSYNIVTHSTRQAPLLAPFGSRSARTHHVQDDGGSASAWAVQMSSRDKGSRGNGVHSTSSFDGHASSSFATRTERFPDARDGTPGCVRKPRLLHCTISCMIMMHVSTHARTTQAWNLCSRSCLEPTHPRATHALGQAVLPCT